MTGYDNSPAPYGQPPYAQSYPLVPTSAMGMVIGGSIAAAHNLHAYRNGEKSRQAAIGDTFKTAVFAGTASFAAGLAAQSIGGRGMTSTVAAVTTGTAVMYMLTKAASTREEKPE